MHHTLEADTWKRATGRVRRFGDDPECAYRDLRPLTASD